MPHTGSPGEPVAAQIGAMRIESLNREQHAAAYAGLGSPPSSPRAVWVNAGAGTGKTATLVARVTALLAAGVAPERLLLLTFSRRAAVEMVRRAGRALASGRLGAHVSSTPTRARLSLPWAGTFHAVAARLLRHDAATLGLDPGFTVLDRADALELLSAIRERHVQGGSRRRIAGAATMLSVMSECVNTDASVAQVLARRHPWCLRDEALFRAVFAEFARVKAGQALLDYDDLLQWAVMALREPEIATRWRSRFDAVVVDESQDCNALQWQLLRGLAPAGRGVFLVGDVAQSIYGFRGADPAGLQAYVSDVGAERLELGRNYRSSQPVLDLANAVLAEADPPCGVRLTSAVGVRGERPRLVLVHDEAAQSDYIIEQVLTARERGVMLREQAVLFRSAHHSDGLELALARANIPFVKYGGLRFIDAVHVRDALAVVRWAMNPANRLAASRALQLLPGIGPAVSRRLLDAWAGQDGASREFGVLAGLPVPAAAREPLAGLAGHLAALSAGGGVRAFESLVGWLAPVFEERYDHSATRLADLDMLAGAARRAGGLREMLTELALDPPQAAGDLGDRAHLDEDQLALSTVHSAKGQEWRNVFLLNVTDGNFPNEYATSDRNALAEERRLFYVALTRARRELHLIEPRCHAVVAQAPLGGRHVTGARSRFLSGPVLACLSRHDGHPDAEPSVSEASETAADMSEPPTAVPLCGIARKLAMRWQPVETEK